MPTQDPTRVLDTTTIQEFRGRLRGRVLDAGHGEYEDARRIQNGLIDRHPALIVRFGRSEGLAASEVTTPKHLGGALSRVAPEATAYGRRDAPYLVTAEATWTDSAQNDQNIHWARELVAAMRPYSRGALYLNSPGSVKRRKRCSETHTVRTTTG